MKGNTGSVAIHVPVLRYTYAHTLEGVITLLISLVRTHYGNGLEDGSVRSRRRKATLFIILLFSSSFRLVQDQGSYSEPDNMCVTNTYRRGRKHKFYE